MSSRQAFASWFMLLSCLLLMVTCESTSKQRITARIELTSLGVLDSLRVCSDVEIIEVGEDYVDVRLTEKRFYELSKKGFEVALLVELENGPAIPGHYRSSAEVWTAIESLASLYPDIVCLHEIGHGSLKAEPIFAVKVSDFPQLEEDEPALLFYGGLHAQEPLGVEVCLHIAQQLCERYGSEPSIKDWIDEAEIWIAPLLNPEGYDFVLSGEVDFPWWRKNLRDNNRDRHFDSKTDGVDLNRNFGFNWHTTESSEPASWYYRGPKPFSESETQALKQLAIEQSFVAGISYHSHGYKVLYPWANFPPAPDAELLEHLAGQMAGRMKDSGKKYDIFPLNGCTGQSSVWMYGAIGSLDFTIELGDEFFPDQEDARREVHAAAEAAFFLIERIFGAGVVGHVRDARTREPLAAQVTVVEIDNPNVWPRRSDRNYGRFDRILAPGQYTLEVSKPGYLTAREIISVEEERRTVVEIQLQLIVNPANQAL